MTEHCIHLVGLREELPTLERLAAQVCNDWPVPDSTPTTRPLPIGETGLFGSAGAGAFDQGVVLLAKVPDQTPPSTVYKAIDHLRAARISGVMIVADEATTRNISSGGIITMPASTSPDLIAATLHALCSRQEAVNELTQDLSISQRSHGGVREEMERISQELSLAANIQRELIPRTMPDVPGLEFGVLYRPAGFVSGDIYNIQQIDDKRIGFFIADAIGHGVPAALLTMIISQSLPMRGGCSEGRLISPSDALARLNDDLCDVSDGNPRFATAVYGIFDFESGFVQIANAGHPAPMVVGRDQTTEIHAGGPLLGVFHDAQFEEQTVELRPGDTLLLYSDGFEMAFPDAKAPDGTKGDPNQYLDHIKPLGRWMEHEGQSLARVFEKLEQKLDQASGSMHQADDLTALAISRQAVAARKAA